MQLKKSREQGDTLIEVLFAIAVFAMVAVGSLSIMNQGTATAQRALEITLVRQQIDAQAEAIRFIHQSYVASYQRDGAAPTGIAKRWVDMTSKSEGKGADGASDFSTIGISGSCPTTLSAQKPFILNTHTATISSAPITMTPPPGGSLPPFAQVIYDDASVIQSAYGIWVEAVPSAIEDGRPGIVDFHIRACWDAAGSSTPATIGTIVRLYEPR